MTSLPVSFAAIALLTSLSTGYVAPDYSAVEKVVTTCESPVDATIAYRQASLETAALTAPLKVNDERTVVKLLKRVNVFDLRFENSSEGGYWQALENGGRVTGMEVSPGVLHIVLHRENNDAEHFLFKLQLDGSGELLWSSADASALTSCNP